MTPELDEDWLAIELAAADEEISVWPQGLRQSFESLQPQIDAYLQGVGEK